LSTYIQLTKPRSVLLLVLAALVSLAAHRPGDLSLGLIAATAVAGALASGGANALNCYLDRDLDRRMERTRRRPLALGLISPQRALLFGLALSAASVVLFAARVNALSAALTAAGILYYVVVYTLWLKRRTSWGVVVGGVAGVLPVLVGSAAATGGVSWLALGIAGIVFLWTPAHFWSLAMARADDYANVGMPMLPVVAGATVASRQIVRYAAAAVVLSVIVGVTGLAGWLYLIAAGLAGLELMLPALSLARDLSPISAWHLYKASSWYLAVVLIGLAADKLGLGSHLISVISGSAW
jgi:heme o synthase